MIKLYATRTEKARHHYTDDFIIFSRGHLYPKKAYIENIAKPFVATPIDVKVMEYHISIGNYTLIDKDIYLTADLAIINFGVDCEDYKKINQIILSEFIDKKYVEQITSRTINSLMLDDIVGNINLVGDMKYLDVLYFPIFGRNLFFSVLKEFTLDIEDRQSSTTKLKVSRENLSYFLEKYNRMQINYNKYIEGELI